MRKPPARGSIVGCMAQGLDQDFLDGFAPRWWTAWNGRDAEAIASMVTDDLVYYNPGLG